MEEFRSKSPFKFYDGPGWAPTDAFLNRLCDSFAITSQANEPPIGSMWNEINKVKSDIVAALSDRRISDLKHMLSNPMETGLYFGMDPLTKDKTPLLRGRSDEYRSWIRNFVVRALVQVAEVSGAVRLWNYERFPVRDAVDVEVILSALDKALGVKVQFPNPFPGEYGLSSSRGVMAFRAPYALYHAIKIRELSEMTGGRKILEIGAGVGRTAAQSWALGLGDYTIVDLPISLIGQACFLAAVLGEDNIWMEGEPRAEGKVRLWSPTYLFACEENFDISVNIDSLTEMSFDQGQKYFEFLSKKTSCLYSMNHDLNEHRVCDMAASLGMKPQTRYISTVRPGYIEELYLFNV